MPISGQARRHREPAVPGSPTALADYDAIPIQADPQLANGATVSTNGNGALMFDGAAGHYLAVTGQVIGDVRYTNLTTGPTFTLGVLTLLTLDVKSNRPTPVLRDHRIAIGIYDRTEAGLVRRRGRKPTSPANGPWCPNWPAKSQPDLVLINDDDLTYAKIRLDPHSMATLSTSISEFTETLPAALCWAAAWDMCRDAELAARDYVRLVLGGQLGLRRIGGPDAAAPGQCRAPPLH